MILYPGMRAAEFDARSVADVTGRLRKIRESQQAISAGI